MEGVRENYEYRAKVLSVLTTSYTTNDNIAWNDRYISLRIKATEQHTGDSHSMVNGLRILSSQLLLFQILWTI